MDYKIGYNYTEQFDKNQFERTANNPKLWISRAEDLHTASEVLREKFIALKDSLGDGLKELEHILLSSGTDRASAGNGPVDWAKILRSSGLVPQSAMLQGFAIEALLKAYHVAKGNSITKDGEYRMDGCNSHDLPSIAGKVQFSLLNDESEVLSRLSLFVSSYGRYPITKAWNKPRLKPNPQGVQHRVDWSDEDHVVAEVVIKRLSLAIKSCPAMLTDS